MKNDKGERASQQDKNDKSRQGDIPDSAGYQDVEIPHYEYDALGQIIHEDQDFWRDAPGETAKHASHHEDITTNKATQFEYDSKGRIVDKGEELSKDETGLTKVEETEFEYNSMGELSSIEEETHFAGVDHEDSDAKRHYHKTEVDLNPRLPEEEYHDDHPADEEAQPDYHQHEMPTWGGHKGWYGGSIIVFAIVVAIAWWLTTHREQGETPVCGNGLVETGEQCDGDDLAGCAENMACSAACECVTLAGDGGVHGRGACLDPCDPATPTDCQAGLTCVLQSASSENYICWNVSICAVSTPAPTQPLASDPCGNGVCDPGEHVYNCSVDCGEPPAPGQPVCVCNCVQFDTQSGRCVAGQDSCTGAACLP